MSPDFSLPAARAGTRFDRAYSTAPWTLPSDASMLTGVLEPTDGTARIGGHDIRTDLDQAKKINGLVPQDLALYPTLSARANTDLRLACFDRHGDGQRPGLPDLGRGVRH